MADLIDSMVEEFVRAECDYLSNTIIPTFPDGLDVEIFDRESLLRLSTLELSKSEKEHVTLGFHNKQNLFKIRNFLSRRDYSDLRWTVDYPQDLEFVRNVYSKFPGLENKFGFNEVLDLIEMNPTIKSSIPAIRRNEALRENS
jgi:spore coat polysaccharide biosynthesis protein SpsF (cytidylyltransferase family)